MSPIHNISNRQIIAGGERVGSQLIKNDVSNNIKNDESQIKIKYITINNLLLSDFDIQFYKKINSDKNTNLMKNLQIINEYAKICGANSYNDCLNTTELSNSNIKANIISINLISKKIINSVSDSNIFSSNLKSKPNNVKPNNVKPNISSPIPITNQKLLINSGGYLKKHKKYKKSNKRNKTLNKRNKTLNKRNKTLNNRNKTLNKRND